MKKVLVTIFAILFLLAFVALGVYLVFIGDGVWSTEDGSELNGIQTFGVKGMLFVFLIAFPLTILLWILFPKLFNKLFFKAMNKGIRGGARMMAFRDRCEEQNIPDITVNGINLPAVMAAADLVGDKINGEDIPEFADMKGIPQICEQCGFVRAENDKFCRNCGAAIDR